MELVIDIGNTYTKIAVFEHNRLLYSEQFQPADSTTINNLLADYPVTRAIISTVKKEKDEWQSLLAKKVGLIYFNNGMTSGITNHYLPPQTLGADRLAAVIGAFHCYPGQSNLV